ncbi:tetratricopeptide repeat protein [Rhodothermus bifroesti]|uniref:Tetratricopeptide repeat protein n=1 Tax=Rhodothermus marinus TaxID=29549 RepID=A0A7V2F6J9_RHOMR
MLRIRLWIGLSLLIFTGCRPTAPEAYRPPSERVLTAAQAARLHQAWQAYAQGAYQHAMQLADSLLQEGAEIAEVYLLKGRIYLDINAFEEALTHLEKARALDAYLRGIDFQIGHAAFLQGFYRRALAYYLKELALIEQSPTEVQRYYAETDRIAKVAIYRQAGRACFLLDSLQAARQFYHRALELDSLDSESYRWLAELEEQEGNLQTALQLAEKALALNPKELENLYTFARLLLRTGHTEDAVHFLQLVLERHPLHRGANYNLGRALMLRGETRAGEFYLARAQRIQQLTGKIDQARLAAYQTGDVRHWKELATLLIEAGRYVEARRALDVVLFLEPHNLALENDRANLALLLGDTLDALARYQQLLRRDPTLADVWLNLGVVYAQQKQYEAARKAWQQALRYRPDDDTLRQYLQLLDRRMHSEGS